MNTSATQGRRDRALWVQYACTALVALGAAYASYRHGREFALWFGADETTASTWPLIVDGLLTTATVELWKTGRGHHAGGRWAAWLAFVFGICLSLCANVAAALESSAFAIAVAACPPLALLLAVELLNRALKRHRAETGETRGASDETGPVVRLAPVPVEARPPTEPTAEQRMWVYYVTQRSKGHTPTGAELDHIAGTNNDGRRVLRRWKTTGQIGDGDRANAGGSRRPVALGERSGCALTADRTLREVAAGRTRAGSHARQRLRTHVLNPARCQR